MKRLIKYNNVYASDKAEFSDCSTIYEVLPYVVEDNAESSDLRSLAIELGFNPAGNAQKVESKRWSSIKITHAIPIGEVEVKDYFKTEMHTQYLGFITIKEPTPYQSETPYLSVDVACEGTLTQDDCYNIFNHQDFDIYGPIELDSENLMLIQSWSAYHYLNILGYKFDDLMKISECEETIFDDSVTSCGECGAWMYNDNGYTYNYRIVNDCELLGLECGCYDDHMKNNWSERINDTKTPIELNIAKELEESGELKHLERFIGGMTDGRGGWFNGESCEESSPEEALEKYQNEMPECDFIITHDESGQFQTYFSIWQVCND